MKSGLDNEYVQFLVEKQGFEIYSMIALPQVMDKFTPWEFLGMCQRGGDVEGLVIYDNTKDWRFDCPVDPEQSFLYIVPSEKGKFILSATEWDAKSIVEEMYLEQDFEQWEEENERNQILQQKLWA